MQASVSYALSEPQRQRSTQYLETLQAANRGKLKALSGTGRESLEELALVEEDESELAAIGSVEPKVIEVHAHAVGSKPRKVTVERKKRYFASLEIAALLEERRISMEKLIHESHASLQKRNGKLIAAAAGGGGMYVVCGLGMLCSRKRNS